MTATGIRFLPGHKIRIEITSSWFNRFDRNLQTGAEKWMRDEGESVVATQTIFHDGDHAPILFYRLFQQALYCQRNSINSSPRRRAGI